mmetsp:Transcript_40054/g.86384  ORF Transcript_40054/g.86384 Transcript_40054/m.86384 type:complete len:675 (-) Transcript_40054:145-2169(-)
MGKENETSSTAVLSISMVEGEADFVHVIGSNDDATMKKNHTQKSKDRDDNVTTPATSTSSSPALLPTESPLDVDFERLNANHDLDVTSPPSLPVPVALPPATATLPATITTSSNDDNNEASSRWMAPPSAKSLRTHNPIRAIVDPIMVANSIKSERRIDGKDLISLALGDPTAYGNLPPCPAILSAIARAIRIQPLPNSDNNNSTTKNNNTTAGYVNACGTIEARSAIARHHSFIPSRSSINSANIGSSDSADVDGESFVPSEHLSKEDVDAVESPSGSSSLGTVSPMDVIVANGASGALELALTALLDEDSILLVPRPGFPLYQVIAESHGATVMQYDLLPDKSWECDLEYMERIIIKHQKQQEGEGRGKSKVIRGILVNNPSNPTGAVYAQTHLMEIVKLATKYRVPIVADEIYGDMTFGGKVFHPMADVAARLGYEVPIITASGLGKQYLVPGWRLGWIVFQDNIHGSIRQVQEGAQRLAQVVLGASHLAQVAIPAVLAPTSTSLEEEEEEDKSQDGNDCVTMMLSSSSSTALWKAALYSTMEKQATLLCGLLDQCRGLRVIFPEGAMYAMVRIEVDKFDDLVVDDVSFMKLLLEEENIVVLPGCAFGLGGGAKTKDNGTNGNDDARSSYYVFRVVFCAPEHILRTASKRIASFCLRHKSTDLDWKHACFG